MKGIVTGYLDRDPELRFTTQGRPVLTLWAVEKIFNFKTGGLYDRKTKITVWGDYGAKLNDKLKKGDAVLATGEVRASVFTPEGKEPLAKLELTADNVTLVSAGEGAKQETPDIPQVPDDDMPF